MKYIKLVMYGITLIVLVSLGVKILGVVGNKILPKPPVQTIPVKVDSGSKGVKVTVANAKVATVNRRGDKRIEPIVGTVQVDPGYFQNGVEDVPITINLSEVIKAPSRKFSAGAYVYPGKVVGGVSYEIFTLGDICDFCRINPNAQMYDIGFNVGITQESPVIVVTKVLSPLFSVYVGAGKGNTVYGVGIRF